MRPSLRSSGHIQTDIRAHPRAHVPSPGFHAVVCICRSACPADPCACAPLPLSAALMTLAEESDDKCPLSANEADDKWAGARAAPLRCNNRRWMAWRPPPHPHPPAPVTGADPAPPAGEGAALRSPAANPDRPAETPEPGAVRPRGRPRRRNKAERSAGAGGARGVPPARTRSCAHTWPAHAPAACVLARCTCGSCPGTTPTSTALHRLTSATWIFVYQRKFTQSHMYHLECLHIPAEAVYKREEVVSTRLYYQH